MNIKLIAKIWKDSLIIFSLSSLLNWLSICWQSFLTFIKHFLWPWIALLLLHGLIAALITLFSLRYTFLRYSQQIINLPLNIIFILLSSFFLIASIHHSVIKTPFYLIKYLKKIPGFLIISIILAFIGMMFNIFYSKTYPLNLSDFYDKLHQPKIHIFPQILNIISTIIIFFFLDKRKSGIKDLWKSIKQGFIGFLFYLPAFLILFIFNLLFTILTINYINSCPKLSILPIINYTLLLILLSFILLCFMFTLYLKIKNFKYKLFSNKN